MNQNRLIITVVSAVCCITLVIVLASSMHGQAVRSARPTPTPTPVPTPTPLPKPPFDVTSTIYDFDDASALLLMHSDDYQGAGQAVYSTLKAKKGASQLVASTINDSGEWELALNDQSGRTVWITPNQAIDNAQPSAPPAGYYVIQKTYSNCRDQAGNTVFYPNLVNGSGNCSMAVNFFYGGVLYKLLMRSGALEGTTCPVGGCPVTGLAKAICNSVTGSQCVNWTIIPNSDAPLYGVSNLYSYTGSRGSEWVFIGQYYNTFRINATNP